MDFSQITFLGLIGLGTVNVLTMYKSDMDSKLKFGISAAVVFIATFIPAELGNIIFDKLKLAIEVALASSGGYTLAKKAGGK
jgi:hypothetical protein